MITAIGVAERERGMTCTQKNNKTKLERLHSAKLIQHGPSGRLLDMQRPQMHNELACLHRLTPITFNGVLAMLR
jgi:hypothetical protein